jgi:hypothetical protein
VRTEEGGFSNPIASGKFSFAGQNTTTVGGTALGRGRVITNGGGPWLWQHGGTIYHDGRRHSVRSRSVDATAFIRITTAEQRNGSAIAYAPAPLVSQLHCTSITTGQRRTGRRGRAVAPGETGAALTLPQ